MNLSKEKEKVKKSLKKKTKWSEEWTYLLSTWQAPDFSGQFAALTLPHTLIKKSYLSLDML